MSLEQHISNLITSQEEESDYLRRQIEEMQEAFTNLTIKKTQLEAALVEKRDLDDAFDQLKQERDQLAARVKVLEGESQDDFSNILNLKLKAMKEGGPINMSTT